MIGASLRFLFSLLIFLVIALALDFFIVVEVFKLDFGFTYYFTFVYFTFAVVVIQLFIIRSLRKRPQQFVWTFMACLGIKMFASLILLLLMIYSGVDHPKVFGINFAVLYLLFSTFSVIHILKAQKVSLGKGGE